MSDPLESIVWNVDSSTPHFGMYDSTNHQAYALVNPYHDSAYRPHSLSYGPIVQADGGLIFMGAILLGQAIWAVRRLTGKNDPPAKPEEPPTPIDEGKGGDGPDGYSGGYDGGPD